MPRLFAVPSAHPTPRPKWRFWPLSYLHTYDRGRDKVLCVPIHLPHYPWASSYCCGSIHECSVRKGQSDNGTYCAQKDLLNLPSPLHPFKPTSGGQSPKFSRPTIAMAHWSTFAALMSAFISIWTFGLQLIWSSASSIFFGPLTSAITKKPMIHFAGMDWNTEGPYIRNGWTSYYWAFLTFLTFGQGQRRPILQMIEGLESWTGPVSQSLEITRQFHWPGTHLYARPYKCPLHLHAEWGISMPFKTIMSSRRTASSSPVSGMIACVSTKCSPYWNILRFRARARRSISWGSNVWHCTRHVLLSFHAEYQKVHLLLPPPNSQDVLANSDVFSFFMQRIITKKASTNKHAMGVGAWR